MARSDLLIDLVRAATESDAPHLRRALEALITEERAKQHHVLADRLAEFLDASPARALELNGPSPNDDGANLFRVLHPRRTLESLVLSEGVRGTVADLVEEHHRRELLRSHALEPRHRILLTGPPGNGKTTLSEAIAEALMVPMVVVRYESVIGSFLGETSSRLRRVFEFVRTRQCVLFFDEFDTLGKERGDPHDTGEVKRVVSSLLLQIDDLPSHVVVITATNHPELLDRAVWRRFEIRLELPPPDAREIKRWLLDTAHRLDARLSEAALARANRALRGASYAELEAFRLDVLRRSLLDADASPSAVFNRQVSVWMHRASAAPAQARV